jgi:hypothetical protein
MTNNDNINAPDPSIEIVAANPITKDSVVSKEVKVKAHYGGTKMAHCDSQFLV